jgi:hypothetical protein
VKPARRWAVISKRDNLISLGLFVSRPTRKQISEWSRRGLWVKGDRVARVLVLDLSSTRKRRKP